MPALTWVEAVNLILASSIAPTDELRLLQFIVTCAVEHLSVPAPVLVATPVDTPPAPVAQSQIREASHLAPDRM